MSANGRPSELDLERQALDHIRSVHGRYLDRSRAVARGLAAEAAEAVDDGIRDIVDEDAEADAAVQAVLVRQMSERAMHAARRVADLEAQGDALAFGKVVDGDDEERYVGRRTVLDGDDVLLVDWRARAAVPFYRATPLQPMGVRRRRHLLYDDPRPETTSELVDYSDEVFDPTSVAGQEEHLRGEAALLTALDAPTREQMQTVVATIQAEQDAVIRAPANQTLVVQGGPGTGKTVVALHRAAYLLYDQRVELAETGVLIVGPSRRFLRYVSQVLPSLGESGVVSITVPHLYRGIRLGRTEDAEVADCKGSAAMVDVLAAAVAMRRRPPTERLICWYGSRRVVIDLDRLQHLYRRACRHRQHNDGANAFRRLLVDALAAEVYDRSFHDLDEARRSFATNQEVSAFLLGHFPTLSPEQALNDLLGSPRLLRAALRQAGVPTARASLLQRERTAERHVDRVAWSEADAALLDELLSLLGPVVSEPEPDASDGTGALGRSVTDSSTTNGTGDGDAGDGEPGLSDDEEFSIEPYQRPDHDDDTPFPYRLDDPYIDDPGRDSPHGDDGRGGNGAGPTGNGQVRSGTATGSFDHRRQEVSFDVAFADPAEAGPGFEDGRPVPESDGTPAEDLDLEAVDAADEASATVLELAALERSWQFGHVIVDEAQDLTAMQWRMVARRAGSGITIVGDLAQRAAGPVDGWHRLVPPMLDDIILRELTINYRSPRELDGLTHGLLHSLAPGLTPARSIRSSGHDIIVRQSVDVARTVVEMVRRERRRWPDRRLCVISDDPDLNTEVVAEVTGVEAMTAPQVKGLEFDVVVVVEPAAIVDRPGGLGLLYVAVTRPTQRLAIVHDRPLPAVMAGLLRTGGDEPSPEGAGTGSGLEVDATSGVPATAGGERAGRSHDGIARW